MNDRATGLIAAAVGVVLAASGAAKIAAVRPMRDRAAHLMYSTNAYRLIGAVEVGAAVAIAGGRCRPALGAAASSGVVALMVGAVLSHRRVEDSVLEMAPALAVGAGAAGTAAAFVRRARGPHPRGRS